MLMFINGLCHLFAERVVLTIVVVFGAAFVLSLLVECWRGWQPRCDLLRRRRLVLVELVLVVFVVLLDGLNTSVVYIYTR
jgi:hypothetical protein